MKIFKKLAEIYQKHNFKGILNFLFFRVLSSLSKNIRRALLFIVSDNLRNILTKGEIFSIKDLNNELQKKKRKILIKGFEYGSSVNKIPNVRFSSYSKFLNFSIRRDFSYKFDRFNAIRIKTSRYRDTVTIEEPVFVFDYYVTHFGHFTGEILGSIYAYAIILSEKEEVNRKVVIAFNGKDSNDLLEVVLTNSFQTLSIDIRKNYIFNNAITLPILHPIQSLSYVKNVLARKTEEIKIKETYKKIFITSGRENRIQNIDEVISFFNNSGFFVYRNDSSLNILELVKLMKLAEIVVIEEASLSHLAIMANLNEYFVISSTRPKYLNDSEFEGGGIFDLIDLGKRIYVDTDQIEESCHSYSSKLNVKMDKLKKLFCQ